MSESKEEKCVWAMGTPCSKDGTKDMEFFGKQIKVPVCPNHLEQHMHIMALAKNGYDVEAILQESPDYRKEQFLILQLSGLDVEKVDP